MTDIAKEAGISRPTLYKYFRNKDKDSFGKNWIFNWHCLDHVGYKNNPRRRDIGYHKIFDHYRKTLKKYHKYKQRYQLTHKYTYKYIIEDIIAYITT